jgi:hypothetical protein
MNWDMIGALAELLGAAGVVISLVYLGSQTRSNTRALKASAGFEATHSWATFNETAIGWSDEFFESAIKAHDHSVPLTDFSELQVARLAFAWRALFQKLEGLYFLRKHGSLEPELWEKRRVWARGFINSPLQSRWWEIEKQQGMFTDEFVGAIESADLLIQIQPFGR